MVMKLFINRISKSGTPQGHDLSSVCLGVTWLFFLSERSSFLGQTNLFGSRKKLGKHLCGPKVVALVDSGEPGVDAKTSSFGIGRNCSLTTQHANFFKGSIQENFKYCFSILIHTYSITLGLCLREFLTENSLQQCMLIHRGNKCEARRLIIIRSQIGTFQHWARLLMLNSAFKK